MKELIDGLQVKLENSKIVTVLIFVIPILTCIILLIVDFLDYFFADPEYYFIFLYPSWYILTYISGFFAMNLLAIFLSDSETQEYVVMSWIPIINTTIPLYFVISIIFYYFHYLIIISAKKTINIVKYQEELINNIKERI